jgi:hypothetical protein
MTMTKRGSIHSPKRRSLTLLEVMIALSLAAVLLSALMSSYYQVSKQRITAQELKKNSLSVEVMRQRLIHLFAQTAAAETVRFHTGTHPSALGSCLIFTYCHGIDLKPEFCGDLTGMLYLNAHHQLALASWGSSSEARVEVLLENIGEVFFSFFDAKMENWRADWKKELPPFFKLSWTSRDQSAEIQQCAFFFSQETPITYETQVSAS